MTALASDATKTSVEEIFERAMGLQIAGKLELAEPLYRSILDLQPGHAGAHYCLGMLLVQSRRVAQASPHLLAAVNAQPHVAEYWLGYLEALLLAGEYGQAAETLALARRHGLAGAATDDFESRLGTQRTEVIQRLEAAAMALINQERFRETLPLARNLTERFPEYGAGWKLLGAVLWSIGSESEAIEAMQTSARLLPADAEAHKNLAAAVNKQQRLDDAEAHLRRALEIDPNYGPAHLVLGHNFQLQGRYAEARRSLQLAVAAEDKDAPGLNSARSLLLFVLNNDPSVSADLLFAEHRKVGKELQLTERASHPRRRYDRNPDRALKVGFVSGDLNNHSIGLFMEPLLAQWQRSDTVHTTIYYVNKVEDLLSRRLRGYVSAWHPVLDLSTAQLEQRIVDDGIDILVDLSGHTALHRLGAFARKPAPLQVSWLGYPNTTGLSTVDYYLGDKFFLPPGQFERYFTEQLVQLPAAWTFQPSERAPAVNPLPALTAGHVTFGSFNRIAKINEPTIRLWSRLLGAVPGSRMLLAGVPVDIAQRQLTPWFADAGIEPDRVSFHAYAGQENFLALHRLVDIALEPMPYSGCTTSNHALWMGVPSLTCVGTTPASRLTAANLGHLGLEDFIAVDVEDFIARGLRWTNDLAALSELRMGMRARWQNAPARNSKFFAAGMELALRHMWRRWCAGKKAKGFEITAQQAAAKAAQ